MLGNIVTLDFIEFEIKQLLSAAVNKCSGDYIPGMPFRNSGGVATSMQLPASLFSSGEHITPLRSVFQFTTTLEKCGSILSDFTL